YGYTASFALQADVLNSAARTGFVRANIPRTPVFVNFSAYGQDTWQVSRRLTLNLGMRWEVNPAPIPASGPSPVAVTQVDNLSTMQLEASGTQLWKTTYANLAPRIGVAYQIRDTSGRELVVRGGFGVFYDTGNEMGTRAYSGSLFGTTQSLSIVRFPLQPVSIAPPIIPVVLSSPYPVLTITDPRLELPYTLQWNLAAEQSLGSGQSLTLSYVGAAGRRLLQSTQFNLAAVNPRFTTVLLVRNGATSDYHALQAQFQRRLLRGLQGLASYTWSHALDDDSNSITLRVAQRGNADFDVRHNFALAVTYDLPVAKSNSFVHAILGHWSIDSTLHAQSSAPIDLIAASLTNPIDGSVLNVRPNVIAGVPTYVYGDQYPGGRIVNDAVPSAAQIAAAGCNPAGPAKGAFCTPLPGRSGNLGRNVVRGLPSWQVDVALRREFNFTEKLKLQFRAEAFNLLNHPNFGGIQTNLGSPNFGQATTMLNQQLTGLSPLYQIGGPRSFQFALKLLF
ncbi:MAG: TonB-dependent receptor, partial [Pyrinomonadaceae bacterium]